MYYKLVIVNILGRLMWLPAATKWQTSFCLFSYCTAAHWNMYKGA